MNEKWRDLMKERKESSGVEGRLALYWPPGSTKLDANLLGGGDPG